MSELATVETGSTLTLAEDQTFWTDKQVAGLRQLGVDRATNGDLAVFLHVCQRTGLDPFARQIYMIERQGKQTIQTGIDGFRLVARRAVDRTGETLSIGPSEWCDQDGIWSDVWLKDYPPAAARVVVYRNGEAFPGTALWREYVQYKRDGNVMAQWATRPAGMLAKCAEALALRKAFPHDLSGIYTDDELTEERREQRRRSRLGDALNQTSGAEDAPDPSLSGERTDSSAPEPEPITSGQLTKIGILCGELGLSDPAEARREVGAVVGREIKSRKDLSKSEAHRVIDRFESMVQNPFPDAVDADVVEPS